MKKIFTHILVWICLAALFTSCLNSERQQVISEQLQRLDAYTDSLPNEVLDSLEQISLLRLSSFNKGYHALLQTIAMDKTYYDFTSDSLINKSVSMLAKHKKKKPDLYARSLMYQGIVLYRMGVTDSTAYLPLKEAARIMEAHSPKDYKALLFCYNYMGLIHHDNNNLEQSIYYLKLAIHTTEKHVNQSYLFNIYRDLFWIYMRLNDLTNSQQYLDTLSHLRDMSVLQNLDVDICKASYYEATKEYEKAIATNLSIAAKLETPSSSTLIRLSQNYRHLNKLDSALYYSELAQKAITDTNNYYNYLYYRNTAEIAQALNLWEKSAEAYKKENQLRDLAVERELDTQIIELEKKYDLTLMENQILKQKKQHYLLVLFIIVLAITMVFGWLYVRQYQKRSRLKIELIEIEKKKIRRSLVEKDFILPIYKQISLRNANIKAVLFDLTTNSHIIKNPHLTNIIKETYEDLDKTTRIDIDKLLTLEQFCKFTGLSEESSKLFNNNEKMLLVFIALQLDNKQIAVLFNTSESSIRGRKAKLRKKLDLNHIVFNQETND